MLLVFIEHNVNIRHSSRRLWFYSIVKCKYIHLFLIDFFFSKTKNPFSTPLFSKQPFYKKTANHPTKKQRVNKAIAIKKKKKKEFLLSKVLNEFLKYPANINNPNHKTKQKQKNKTKTA